MREDRAGPTVLLYGAVFCCYRREAGELAVNHPEPLLYTCDEAARLLNCNASWLTRKAREGVIPFTRIGRTRCFSDANLAAILEIFSVRPTAQRIEPTVTDRFAAWMDDADAPEDPSLQDAFVEGFAQALEWTAAKRDWINELGRHGGRR